MRNPTREAQERHFRQLLAQHSGTPMAVSSESAAHKSLRFKHITNILRDADIVRPSIHDVGMGLGDLRAYLEQEMTGTEIEYSGTDILREFVDLSARRFPDSRFYCRDLAESPAEEDEKYDFVVLSGVFHQRRESSVSEWEAFTKSLILNSWSMCRVGLAFNLVSPFVDFTQEGVYYADIPEMLRFVAGELSRFFRIDHDYALFEATFHVYREEYILSLHPQPEFTKYFRL